MEKQPVREQYSSTDEGQCSCGKGRRRPAEKDGVMVCLYCGRHIRQAAKLDTQGGLLARTKRRRMRCSGPVRGAIARFDAERGLP